MVPASALGPGQLVKWIMTLRAIIIGIISAVIFAAGGRYVEAYGNGPRMVRGQMPVSVYGLLICFVLLINPLVGRLRQSWRLRPAEMATVLALLLSVCTIIDVGMLRFWPNMCVNLIQAERTRPGWQKAEVLQLTPPSLLANGGKYSEEVVENWVLPGDPIVWPATWWKPTTWADPNVPAALSRSVSKSWQRVQWGAWTGLDGQDFGFSHDDVTHIYAAAQELDRKELSDHPEHLRAIGRRIQALLRPS